MHDDIATRLDRIDRHLSHLHDMTHALASAVAEIARTCRPPGGGLTPAETAQVTGRLHAAAAKLEGIPAPRPVPPA